MDPVHGHRSGQQRSARPVQLAQRARGHHHRAHPPPPGRALHHPDRRSSLHPQRQGTSRRSRRDDHRALPAFRIRRETPGRARSRASSNFAQPCTPRNCTRPSPAWSPTAIPPPGAHPKTRSSLAPPSGTSATKAGSPRLRSGHRTSCSRRYGHWPRPSAYAPTTTTGTARPQMPDEAAPRLMPKPGLKPLGDYAWAPGRTARRASNSSPLGPRSGIQALTVDQLFDSIVIRVDWPRSSPAVRGDVAVIAVSVRLCGRRGGAAARLPRLAAARSSRRTHRFLATLKAARPPGACHW